MTAERKLLLKDLLSKQDEKYIVPVYQREYKWDKKECTQLLKDIAGCIENEKDDMFIGSITYQKEPVGATGSRLYIIDGQQRLTTIMLLIKALNLISHNILDSNHDDEDAQYVINKTEEIIFIDRDEKSKGYKFNSSYRDEESFNTIINAQKISEIDAKNFEKDDKIYKNFKIIWDFLDKELKNRNVKNDIWNKGLQQISIIAIRLEPKDNPQEIFESINSKGLALSQIDCIRNYLLMSDQDAQILEKWRSIQDNLIGSSENMNAFIMHYLIAKTNDKVGARNLYQSFREFAEKNYKNENEIDREALIDDLTKYAEIYQYFLTENKYPEKNKYVKDLLNEIIGLKRTTVYPFLLQIFLASQENPEFISESELAKILNLLVVWLLRGIICKVSSNHYGNFIPYLYKKAFNIQNKTNDAYSQIYSYFKENREINSDDDVRENLIKMEIFGKKEEKNRFDFYILDVIQNGRYVRRSDEQVYFDNPTAEHIIPQTPEGEWDKMLGEEKSEIYEKWINTIGNLTLLSGSYNSSLSNGPYQIKREAYEKSKCTNLNGMFKEKEYDEFKLEQIKLRANLLINIVIEQFRIDKPND